MFRTFRSSRSGAELQGPAGLRGTGSQGGGGPRLVQRPVAQLAQGCAVHGLYLFLVWIFPWCYANTQESTKELTHQRPAGKVRKRIKKKKKKSFVWHPVSGGGSITFTHKHNLILFLRSHSLCLDSCVWKTFKCCLSNINVGHSYSYCGTYLSFKCFMNWSFVPRLLSKQNH